MKIGMVSDTYIPKIGGAEIHVRELTAALRKGGHDVEVLTTTSGEPEIDGAPVTRLSYSPWDSGTDWKTLGKRDLSRIISFVRDNDVVHLHYTYFAAALVGTIATALRTPSVVTLHGLGTLDSSVGDSTKMKAFRRMSFWTADQVIATSDEMAAVARRFCAPEDVTRITNGVDTTEFDPDVVTPEPHDGEETLIVSVRRLNPKNGVQYLVEASPAICENVGNPRILIAGNGGKEDMMTYLQNRASELGTRDAITFLGEVPNERVKTLYAAADIATFPSSAESTSIACLEAMAMKCAVVASDLTAYQSMLGDDERGLLVTLFDRDTSNYDAPMTLPDERIGALAESVIRLANDQSLRKDLGERARQYVVDNFDWRSLAEEVEKIYRKAGVSRS